MGNVAGDSFDAAERLVLTQGFVRSRITGSNPTPRAAVAHFIPLCTLMLQIVENEKMTAMVGSNEINHTASIQEKLININAKKKRLILNFEGKL